MISDQTMVDVPVIVIKTDADDGAQRRRAFVRAVASGEPASTVVMTQRQHGKGGLWSTQMGIVR